LDSPISQLSFGILVDAYLQYLTICEHSADLSQQSHQLQFSSVHSGHTLPPTTFLGQHYNHRIASFIGSLCYWYCLVACRRSVIEQSLSQTSIHLLRVETRREAFVGSIMSKRPTGEIDHLLWFYEHVMKQYKGLGSPYGALEVAVE